MKKQNLVIAGGGSTYTLGMIMSLIAEKDNFPLKSITFYDIDAKRQERVAKATEIILKEKYPEVEEFNYTTDKEEAFTGADFVFVQIRTGGLEMRAKDEEIPLSHGVVGQETCGPGGMAYGMRSIGDMIELINDIRTYASEAWILNYTNPAAIVAEALKREFPNDNKILNICDMPAAIMVSFAGILDKEIWDLVPEYFGLNHFGWFTKIRDKEGNDLTDKLKGHILNKGFAPEDAEIAEDPSWKKTFKQVERMLTDFPEYLPNTYLQYYLYPEKMVDKVDPEYTRANQVMDGREKRVQELSDSITEAGTTEGADLEVDIHGRYMVRVAASLAYNIGDTYIVIVENNGIISNLPDDAMVEVPAQLTSNGPKPFAVGEIPTFQKGLIEGQLAYEKLVVDAYFEQDYNKALQALTLNRTVVDTPVAKEILDELIEANEDYWPELK
ncbi:family 4 glycosyl hydrolase, alpha-galactosidase/6-phospho-beta-glucosidase [Halobacteroides halobius DSM 5150]|uniref:Family 4 glycosyl hydrolase, alpha-galactosidase/6-phospho-beta-glucosidase n=1 Tax=Halobacteroides halobius (strain ATCC 35273 / DSM 5150 / MD-1) TaxID=748449 RepID=L0KAU2_HALHC|nr:6-phospho-alpha-glucosidase [Halobacteroides halobius]AGB42407.1 family 4 glycosyl hydrolase, alpha-galactosidase/6-phospho-beta-glucosidase [Halobacteroides halobius DSM 5150]